MSIRTAALAAVCAFALLGAGPAAAVSLTPLPQSLTEHEGALPVAGRFVITWTGCREPMLDRAAERFQRDLARLTGVETFAAGGPALEITCAAADPGALTLKAREAYRLQVSPRGVALQADGPVGVLRGLATLRQLLETGPGGAACRLGRRAPARSQLRAGGDRGRPGWLRRRLPGSRPRARGRAGRARNRRCRPSSRAGTGPGARRHRRPSRHWDRSRRPAWRQCRRPAGAAGPWAWACRRIRRPARSR